MILSQRSLVLIGILTFVLPSAHAQHQRLGMEGSNPVQRGQTLFDWVWEPTTLPRTEGKSDGLGPMFNARSCAECHHQGGTGGAGSKIHNIEILTVRLKALDLKNTTIPGESNSKKITTSNQAKNGSPLNQSLDPETIAKLHAGLSNSASVLLHKGSLNSGYYDYQKFLKESNHDFSIEIAERNTPSLFGLGLVDKIEDSILIEQEKRQQTLGLSGRLARTPDNRIGKFGWKAQKATLREFIEEAAAVELGLETPKKHQASDPRRALQNATATDLSNEQIDSITAFVSNLPRPPQADARNTGLNGGQIFYAIGCGGCHVANLGHVKEIYTDLLLHKMKHDLHDPENYQIFGHSKPLENAKNHAGALPGEWRTPALWGVGITAPYMHDGRALSLEEAIDEHGGEAEKSARNFQTLEVDQKMQLMQFLKSL